MINTATTQAQQNVSACFITLLLHQSAARSEVEQDVCHVKFRKGSCEGQGATGPFEMARVPARDTFC